MESGEQQLSRAESGFTLAISMTSAMQFWREALPKNSTAILNGMDRREFINARSDLLEQRRAVMETWAAFVTGRG